MAGLSLEAIPVALRHCRQPSVRLKTFIQSGGAHGPHACKGKNPGPWGPGFVLWGRPAKQNTNRHPVITGPTTTLATIPPVGPGRVVGQLGHGRLQQ